MSFASKLAAVYEHTTSALHRSVQGSGLIELQMSVARVAPLIIAGIVVLCAGTQEVVIRAQAYQKPLTSTLDIVFVSHSIPSDTISGPFSLVAMAKHSEHMSCLPCSCSPGRSSSRRCQHR